MLSKRDFPFDVEECIHYIQKDYSRNNDSYSYMLLLDTAENIVKYANEHFDTQEEITQFIKNMLPDSEEWDFEDFFTTDRNKNIFHR